METLNNKTNPLKLFENLSIAKHRFTLLFAEKATIPEFPAIGLRGVLGWSIQETVCPFQNKKYNCNNCIVNTDCPYFCLYEQKSAKPGFSEAPKGYMLYAPPNQKGPQITVELTLFGKCCAYLPAVTNALFASGKKGLSGRQNQFMVTAWQEIPPTNTQDLPISTTVHTAAAGPFPLPDWLNSSTHTSLKITTPLRLRKKGRDLKKMDWPFFYSSLARRLEGLNQCYGDGQGFGKENWLAVNKDFNNWPQPVGKTRWLNLQRYSSRQKKKIPLSGIIGNAALPKTRDDQNQWLQVASLISVGKGAVMGLGNIQFNQ
jgi:hypothetical protein